MTIKQLTINSLKQSSVSKLCDLWDETEKQEMTQEVADIRGWLMDALESKSPVFFSNWIDSLEDSPRRYFQ
jgi:hypothetical protein